MTTPPATSAPTGFSVPVIDLTPYTAGGDPARDDPAARQRVAREIDAACSSIGFMQIVGHGIDDAVIDGLAAAIDDFFALPPETKNGYRVAGANRGYSPPKSETLSLSLGVESAGRMNDFFEAFNVGVEARSFPDLALDEADYGINVWPHCRDFRARVDAYSAEASRVARTLTRAFADALGVPAEVFTGITGHSIDVLRMNNYALPPGPVALDGDLTGMGEHTDFGLVTVLWADRVAGLQVLSTEGVWHDVHPVEGGLLVNLGDLTARLTGDRWMSTLHRVKPPIVDGGIVRRRSAAFFHDGNVDAIVATLPDLPGADPTAYEPITVRDHIAAKLAGSRQGRANTGAVREAARVLAAAQQERR
ncbi:isopenicillin N synthase family dioxygenase [Dietzia psychralcaliphila]|uniref:isopenicillin N synthase family dioxygenase n=1 Tax=Dietzia psychralcaliphila TaxID=139021 RepID=UPI001C1E32D5|nr:2-oxoglutarate and iron-dependent oxygenase domain-containing protein [Dietzia psychralcaliphila]